MTEIIITDSDFYEIKTPNLSSCYKIQFNHYKKFKKSKPEVLDRKLTLRLIEAKKAIYKSRPLIDIEKMISQYHKNYSND